MRDRSRVARGDLVRLNPGCATCRDLILWRLQNPRIDIANRDCFIVTSESAGRHPHLLDEAKEEPA